jgi:hypothetical protein
MGADADDGFPRTLPIKILGRNAPKFRESALAIVRAHWPEAADYAVAERLSRGGAYLSLTITVRAVNRAQADAVYRELSAHQDILMVL